MNGIVLGFAPRFVSGFGFVEREVFRFLLNVEMLDSPLGSVQVNDFEVAVCNKV